MKKFGKGKKGESGDEDSSRLALFGSRSKSKSPAPSNNPYAQNFPPDPYTQAKINAGVASPPQGQAPGGPGRGLPSGPKGGLPSTPKSGYGMNDPTVNRQSEVDNKYGNQANGRYGSEGIQGGYGGDRYGGTGGPRNSGRPGGYGGLGADTAATDDNRDALFGGAKDRYAQQQESRPPPYEANQSGPGGYGSNERSYGAYEDRQMTAEEIEEEDITAIKQEMRDMKRSDVSSTRNALMIAAQAEETGRNTLARLGAQGERIHNTEKNLDLAANSNRVAEERAKELKHLNRSMFAVRVGNPFNAKGRAMERDEEIMKLHQKERSQREQTREAAFQSGRRMEQSFKDLSIAPGGGPANKSRLADRAKYQFEADDSEDDQMEDEIDSNLDQLGQVAGRLHSLAIATGSEVEAQNKHLERIAGKSDFVDDQIHMNRKRLDRIK